MFELDHKRWPDEMPLTDEILIPQENAASLSQTSEHCKFQDIFHQMLDVNKKAIMLHDSSNLACALKQFKGAVVCKMLYLSLCCWRRDNIHGADNMSHCIVRHQEIRCPFFPFCWIILQI